MSNTYQGVMAKNKYIAIREDHFTRKELKNVNNNKKLFDTQTKLDQMRKARIRAEID